MILDVFDGCVELRLPVWVGSAEAVDLVTGRMRDACTVGVAVVALGLVIGRLEAIGSDVNKAVLSLMPANCRPTIDAIRHVTEPWLNWQSHAPAQRGSYKFGLPANSRLVRTSVFPWASAKSLPESLRRHARKCPLIPHLPVCSATMKNL